MHVAFKKENTGNKSRKTFLKNSGKSQILLINLLRQFSMVTCFPVFVLSKA